MENNNEQDNYRNEIYSKSVRAGKRIYFFDVKATRSVTITQLSRKARKFDQDGNFHFENIKYFYTRKTLINSKADFHGR